MLVGYSFYVVTVSFDKKRTFKGMLNPTTIGENMMDIMGIFLQTYCYIIKMQDAKECNIIVEDLLKPEFRTTYKTIFFCSLNFRDFCIMDTLAMLLCMIKVIEGAKLSNKINIIFMHFSQAGGLMSVFLATLIAFNIMMVPLAQAIWGPYVTGYKTISDTLNSVFMLAYSKGQINEIM